MTPIGATTLARNFHIAYVLERIDNSDLLLDLVINQLAKIVNRSPLIGNSILLANIKIIKYSSLPKCKV
ncbi:MAG: hypothetical protein CM1200mP17_04050 [Woeseia sp.]|nr:MAG: hypothetical protein CM1200mP17_04050 [Woeseia sp.]